MATIGQIVQGFQQQVYREVQDLNVRLARRMITERLSGGAGLSRRSGRLAGSVNSYIIGQGGPIVVGRTSIGGGGVPYAGVQEFGATQTPKAAKNLAIPLGAARTPAGVPKFGSPRSWPKPLRLITTRSGKKLLVESNFKTVQSKGFNLMGTRSRTKVLIRDRKSFSVRLPGWERGKSTVRNEIIKAIYVLKPSATVPPRLGFFTAWRIEAQETVNRLRRLAKNP